jgi:7-alpha-hydroxysteroid dehydrogenase
MVEAGADVVCSDIDMKSLAFTVEKVKKIGRKAIGMTYDVSKEDDVINMVNKTVETFGRKSCKQWIG